jgi:hypothetical protein
MLIVSREQTDAQFKNQIQTYLKSFRISSETQGPRPQDEFYSMLATALRLIEASRQVDKNFRSLIATAESVQNELKKEDAKNTWEEDKKEAVQLLKKGMKLSMKRIEQLIPEAVKTGKQASSIDISSDLSYNEASRFFTNTHPQEKRLRETLVQTTKAVKRIVHFLPEQDDN